MIENLNASIFKLIILTSLSQTASFSQAKMKFSNHLSISKSAFSRMVHPVMIYQPLSAVSFDLCLFTKIQTTAIRTFQNNLFQQRIIFQLDGSFISNTHLNITQCIFKYCISHHNSGCFNFYSSRSTIKYNIFSKNRGRFGGSFHALKMWQIILNQNLFDSNTAEYFGAAYIETKHNNIQSSQNNFTRNFGSKWVGALELLTFKSSCSVLRNLIFDQNSAKQCAAYFDLSTPPNFHNIEIALFVNNSAERRGGAITDFPFQFRANYTKCIFIGNRCIEGNCIYIETKKTIVMLFDCFFDCTREKALYFNWIKQFPGIESKILYGDDVIFSKEGAKEMIKKKEKEIRDEIPPVKKLEWFLPDP